MGSGLRQAGGLKKVSGSDPITSVAPKDLGEVVARRRRAKKLAFWCVSKGKKLNFSAPQARKFWDFRYISKGKSSILARRRRENFEILGAFLKAKTVFLDRFCAPQARKNWVLEAFL